MAKDQKAADDLQQEAAIAMEITRENIEFCSYYRFIIRRDKRGNRFKLLPAMLTEYSFIFYFFCAI